MARGYLAALYRHDCAAVQAESIFEGECQRQFDEDAERGGATWTISPGRIVDSCGRTSASPCARFVVTSRDCSSGLRGRPATGGDRQLVDVVFEPGVDRWGMAYQSVKNLRTPLGLRPCARGEVLAFRQTIAKSPLQETVLFPDHAARILRPGALPPARRFARALFAHDCDRARRLAGAGHAAEAGRVCRREIRTDQSIGIVRWTRILSARVRPGCSTGDPMEVDFDVAGAYDCVLVTAFGTACTSVAAMQRVAEARGVVMLFLDSRDRFFYGRTTAVISGGHGPRC
jgi:hypothetical protein